MDLDKAKLLVSKVFTDPEIARLYEAGDKLSQHQTKHDIAHAIQVRDLAAKIVAEYSKMKPGALDDWTCEVVIPLAAYLHDIGRAINVDEHAEAGAKWAMGYLPRLTVNGESLPLEVIKRVARIIACHRSSIVHKMDFNDPAWAIVVLADKCVGDEERVRPGRAFILSILTFFRATWIPLRKGGEHDRANFAIKHSDLEIDEKDMVLSIELDRRVCQPSLIVSLYGERFRACVKAARYLDCRFRLEFNGERFACGDKTGEWGPVTRLNIL